MRRTQRALKPGLLAVVLFLAACGGGGDEGGGASIAGTYTCGPEEETGQPQETWELREDGTLTTTAPARTIEGTWSAEGDSLVVTIEGREDRFTIEGDGFVSEADPGAWVCTRA